MERPLVASEGAALSAARRPPARAAALSRGFTGLYRSAASSSWRWMQRHRGSRSHPAATPSGLRLTARLYGDLERTLTSAERGQTWREQSLRAMEIPPPNAGLMTSTRCSAEAGLSSACAGEVGDEPIQRPAAAKAGRRPKMGCRAGRGSNACASWGSCALSRRPR